MSSVAVTIQPIMGDDLRGIRSSTQNFASYDGFDDILRVFNG
ncbi:hypothetical protein [uncultured Nitrospira sp.]